MLPLIDADPVLSRMEWSDVVELAAWLRDRPQISPSTIIDLADCGFRWLFAHSHIKSDDGRPSERPQWWNVGGNAFHAAVEQIELSDPRSRIVDSGHLSLKFIWLQQFEAATKSATETGWSTSSFVAAKRGLENGDWWRVSGEDMLRRYVRYHDADWRAKNTVKSVELDGHLSTFALLPIVGRLDMLTESQVDGSLTVVDFKSGASVPPTTFQLGVYGHMVADIQRRVGEPVDSVRGAYWDARNGAHEHEIEDLLTAHPQVEIMMRAHSAVTTIQAAAYMPRPSVLPGGCGSCPYSKLCPASAA